VATKLMTYANAAGDRWAEWIVGASLEAGLLLVVVGLAWLAIRNRVAPQVGYGLFLLVPLKLLVPLVVTVPVALAHWTPSALVSTWFQGARAAGPIEGQRPSVLAGAAEVRSIAATRPPAITGESAASPEGVPAEKAPAPPRLQPLRTRHGSRPRPRP
jgi:hypothetical protein